MGLRKVIRSDYRRYRATGASNRIEVVCFTQGFWASSAYRLARAVHLWKLRGWGKIPGVGLLATLFCLCLTKASEVITGISLPPQCDIGEGLYIGHFGFLIVNGDTRIGRNCNLSQGVTIGAAGRGEKRGCPHLGDRVFVGAHAILMGNITIGDDAAIGAGAVVTRSVPPRAVVVGNPARVLNYDGSFDFIKYDGMDSDPARLAALQATETVQAVAAVREMPLPADSLASAVSVGETETVRQEERV